MKDKWIYIALGVVAILIIVALVGLNMNNDSTTNTMGRLTNTTTNTTQNTPNNTTNNTNTNNTNNTNTNTILDDKDNEDMLDKTEFNMLKDEAERVAQNIGNNVGNFTQDAIDAFNTAREELMTYDKEERQSQEEIDRRSKNLREAIDNLMGTSNTNNR